MKTRKSAIDEHCGVCMAGIEKDKINIILSIENCRAITCALHEFRPMRAPIVSSWPSLEALGVTNG